MIEWKRFQSGMYALFIGDFLTFWITKAKADWFLSSESWCREETTGKDYGKFKTLKDAKAAAEREAARLLREALQELTK